MEAPSNVPPLDQDLLKGIFAMLILGGHICLPFMLLCIFIRRNPSRSLLFLHFCFSWVFHAIGFSILLYSGNASGPEPAFVPCFVQTVMVYMAPVLESSFLFALVYHLFSTIDAVVNSKAEKSTPVRLIILIGPYLVSIVPAFAVCVAGIARPELVFRGPQYYCSVWIRPITYINTTIVGIFLATAVVLQCRIGLLLYRHRLILKRVAVQGFDLLYLFIRLSLFMAITVVNLAMVLVMMVDSKNKSRIVYQAAFPLIAFLVFGTRLSFYGLERRKEKSVEA